MVGTDYTSFLRPFQQDRHELSGFFGVNKGVFFLCLLLSSHLISALGRQLVSGVTD